MWLNCGVRGIFTALGFRGGDEGTLVLNPLTPNTLEAIATIVQVRGTHCKLRIVQQGKKSFRTRLGQGLIAIKISAKLQLVLAVFNGAPFDLNKGTSRCLILRSFLIGTVAAARAMRIIVIPCVVICHACSHPPPPARAHAQRPPYAHT